MTDHAADPYGRIAELYDLEHDGFAEDIPFYLNSIEIVGDPVLELGCGSGRLVRPIAATGHRITGLDRSPAMLRRLAASIAGSDDDCRITTFAGEMTEAAAAPGGPFGVVIFSLNGLMHLTQPEEQLAALRAARAALDPRGQLLIDVMNPTLEALREFDGRIAHEGTWRDGAGRTVDKFSVRRVLSTEQLIQARLWYDAIDAGGRLERTATAFDLRYLQRHELELMLGAAGFADWQIYGSYDLDPLDDASERMIFAAEVAQR